MRLQELRTWLVSRVTSGGLLIDQPDGTLPEVAGLLAFLPGGRLDLAEAELSPAELLTELTLTGRSPGPWTVPGMPGALLEGVQLHLAFTPAFEDVAAPCIAVCRLAGTFRCGGLSLPVQGNLEPDAGWSLCVAEGTGPSPALLPDLLALIPAAGAARALPAALLAEAGPVPLTDWRLRFDPGAIATTEVSWTVAPSRQWEVLPGMLTVRRVALSPVVCYDPQLHRSVATTVGGAVSGLVALGGTDYQVAARLGRFRHLALEVAPLPGGDPFGLSDLVALIGMGDDAHHLDEGLQQLGFKGLQLIHLLLEIDTGLGKVARAELDGALFMGEVALQAGIRYPELTLCAGLAEGGVHIRELLRQFWPDADSLPDLTLSQLGVFVALRSREVTLKAAVTSDWTVRVGDASLALTELELHLAFSPEGADGRLTGWTAINGAECYASVELPSLQVSLGLADGAVLPLKALADSLLPGALALPPDLPEVTITEFTLNANPRTLSFDLHGAAAVSQGLGVQIGQLDLALTDFELDLARSGGKVSAALGATAAIGGAAFHVGLALPDLTVTAGLVPGATLDLTALVDALLPGELAVPAGLPAVILSDLSLYGSHAERTVRLQARARAEAPGLHARVNRLEVGVTELAFELERSLNRTSARLYTEILVDGTPFAFEFRLPGPDLAAGLKPGARFSLTRAVSQLLPEELVMPEGLPDVTFHRLSLGASPGTGEFSITAASEDTWPIPIGQGLQVGGLSMTVQADRNSAGALVSTGEFSGTVSLGGTDVKALVRLGARDLVVRTQVERLRLAGLLESVLGAEALRTLPVPQPVWDLELTDVTTELAPLVPRFLAAAGAPGFERLFLLVQGGKETASFTAGLIAAPSYKFSQLSPALEPLDAIKFKRTYVILSSTKLSTLPAELAAQVAAGGTAAEIHRGLTFSAAIDLSESELKELLQLSEVDLYGYFDPVSVMAELKGGLRGEFALGTDLVRLKEAGMVLRLQGNSVAVGLATKVGLKVHADDLTFGGEISVGTKSVKGTVNMLGTWHNPLGAQGLSISDVGLDLGFTYATRVPELGIIGTTQIGSVSTTAAVKFDSGDPTRCLLQMRLQNLKLSELLATLCQGPIVEQIPAEIKRTIDTAHFREAEIYIAPQATVVGGIPCEEGIRLKGDVAIWEVEAKAGAELSFDQGLKLNASLSKDIEVGDAFKLTGIEPGHTPHLHVEVPPPGRLPVIDIEGNLSLLNITNQRTKVQVRDAGFYFEQETSLFNLAHAKLKVSGGLQNGSAGIHVRGEFRDNLTAVVVQHTAAIMHQAAAAGKQALTGAQSLCTSAQESITELDGQVRALMAETHATLDRMKADVESKQAAVQAARVQVATWTAAVDAARRAAEADRQRALSYLYAQEWELRRAQGEVDRILGEIRGTEAWYNSLNWFDKLIQAVPTGIKLGALWAAYGVATGVLNAVRGVVAAARTVVANFNIELDPRVVAEKVKQTAADLALRLAEGVLQQVINGLIETQRFLDARFRDVSALLAAAHQALADAKVRLEQVKQGLEIGEQFLDQVIQAAGQVLVVQDAAFEANLDVLKGGRVALDAQIIYLGAPQRIRWQFDFGSPVESAKALADFLLRRPTAAVAALT